MIYKIYEIRNQLEQLLSYHRTKIGLLKMMSHGYLRANRLLLSGFLCWIILISFGFDLLYASEVTLSWAAAKDSDVAGYKIYYDTDSGLPYRPDPADYADEGPPPILVDKGETRFTLHGLTDSKDYYFTVTAFYDSSGPESDFSEEASSRIEKTSKKSAGETKASPPVLLPSEYQKAETDPTAVIYAGDLIDMQVAAQNQMSQSYDVDPDGYIHMPLLGEIKVGEMTIANVQQDLVNRLQRYLKTVEQPGIRILARKRFLLIEGGVRYPGWYHLPHEISLEDLIQLSGGLLEGVDAGEIQIKHKVGYDYQRMKAPATISLSASDILEVPMPDRYQQKIDAGDLLFFRIPEQAAEGAAGGANFRQTQIEVDRFGYVALPTIGNIFVNDKTTGEIEEFLTSKLPKYLAHSSRAQVSIVEKRHYIQLLGHVTHPGWYNVAESANAQMVLNAGGGAVDGAIMNDVAVQRKFGRDIRSIQVNLYQYTITGDERLLLPLQENDTIFVPISPTFGNVKRSLSPWDPPESRLEKETGNKVRIFGAVNAPGVYEPTTHMDLLELLVLARGETSDADLTNIQVIRENKMLQYNLKQLLESSQEIPKIQNGDMIRVAFMERTGFIKQASEEKATIMGAVRQPGGYEVTKDMGLLDLLALASGETIDADMANVQVIRENKMLRYNLKQLVEEFQEIPKIQNGDLVRVAFMQRADYINQAVEAKAKIIGAVKQPGEYEVTKDMNVLDMMAAAKGETSDADLTTIQVIRENRLLQYNLKQLLEDSKEIPKVQDKDTIRIAYMERSDYIKQAVGLKARIIGAVKQPGGYEITKDMTLVDLLALANGQTEDADMSNIAIVRKNGMIKFDLEEYFNNPDRSSLEELPRIGSGDLIQVSYVERADFIKAQNIYVLGKVRSPGVYSLDEGMGVLQALAKAGGLDEWANTKKITIIRRVAGKQENIPFHFHMGVSGKYPELNIRLYANDLVYVP